MAINIRCKCGVDSKLAAKQCPSCGKSFPKKGRRYRVIVRFNGKRTTRTVTNLELAKEIEGKLKVESARGDFSIRRKKVLTLGAIWKKYLPWAEENKKSWKSDMYIYTKHLKPIFENTRLDQISQFDIEKLMITMKKGKNQHGKPYAKATIKHVVVLLSRLYSIADQWGLYGGRNPCKRVQMPKLNNQVTEYLTANELSRLLEVLDNWPSEMDAGFIKFLLYTGLRRGELFRLTWKDINFDRQSVTLRDPKGILDQVLPFSDKASFVLHNLPKNNSDYIFPGKYGGKRVDFKRPWANIKKAAELPSSFRLHGLRHHFASSLVSEGVDLYTVSKLLTHKNTKTTMRYAHLADQTLRDAVNLSDRLQEPKKLSKIIKFRREQ